MIDHRIYHPQQATIPVKPSANKLLLNSNIQGKESKATFTQLLAQKISGVQFSQHALDRLQVRNIKLGQEELAKISTAMDKAAQKGAKESLVLMNNNNLALVVSVKNKTVITAMDSASMKDNVFTNIDSAIII